MVLFKIAFIEEHYHFLRKVLHTKNMHVVILNLPISVFYGISRRLNKFPYNGV